MWKCEKCGREFKKTNQEHFCGNPLNTIHEYIESQPEEVRPLLEKVYGTIREEAPEAIEKISWQMPTFWQGENLIHFAAFKKHIGIYPGDLTDTPFADKLDGYHTSKGAIQFPYAQPIPYELIAEITRYRVLEAQERQRVKKETKTKTKPNKAKPNKAKESEAMNSKRYEFDGVIKKVEDKDGAYIIFPYDVRTEFGKGRVKVHATFDGEPYDGSLVNMGIKNEDDSICYIIGIRKDIRSKIGKQPGDHVHVTIIERE